MKIVTRCVLAIGIIFSTSTFGAVSPLSISILPPVQFPPDDFNITGVRVSVLYGKHRSVYGIDASAIGNITDLNFVGIGVSGVFNVTKGMTTILGLQAAGIANINTNKTNVFGVQTALYNYNSAASAVAGVQLGLVNQSPHTNIYGFQLGVYNKALDVYGFQIGLINSATNLHGLQIGLVNFHEKGLFVVSPFLNFGF